MIRNDYQFKIYFYNWVAAANMVPDAVELSYYEDWLKKYLMSPGFHSYIIDDYQITKSVLVHDFNQLYEIYLKYGQI